MKTVTFTGTVVAADAGKRTITGRLLPFDAVGNTSLGPVMFTRGGSHAVEPGFVLNLEHDGASPIGRATEVVVADDGIDVTFTIAKTSRGDDALVEASEGLRSGLSVEANVIDGEPSSDALVVTASTVIGAALTYNPAYSDAVVTNVAASEAATRTEEEAPVEETSTTEVEVEATQAPPSPKPLYAGVRASNRPLPSAGEWLYASLHRNDQPQAWEDIQAVVKAAAPHTLVEDVPGLIPKAIVGEVFSGRPEDRPVVASLGPFSGPDAGKTFSRPKITDPISDAAAAAEKTDVTDQMKVTGVDFTYEFIKRAANLSAEAIAFTSPQVLDVAVRDLARSYLRGTEKSAVKALEAIDSTATAAAADALEAALYGSAATMYGTLGVLPDRLWIAADVWGFLATAKDKDGRPLYPRLSPSNAGGSNDGGVRMFDLEVAGLRTTVSWAITAGKAILGSSAIVECYENHRVSMRQEEATILGTALGVGGAIALGALDAAGVSAFTVTAQVASP